MSVAKYPGPKGILVAQGKTQSFCSTRALACAVAQGAPADRAFVHDAGNTDWDRPDDRAFIAFLSAVFVYGSDRKAVMGPSLAPFSSPDVALAFIKAHGGTLFSPKELTVERLGCRARN